MYFAPINNKVIYIDVDETLIINMLPNMPLIEKIKEWKGQGRSIIIWTSNSDGVKHAIKAVKFCDIEKYVDLCLPKPQTIVDDDHLEYYDTIDPESMKWKANKYLFTKIQKGIL